MGKTITKAVTTRATPKTEEEHVENLMDSIKALIGNKGTGSNPKGDREITTEVEMSSTVRKIVVPQDMDLMDASEELKSRWANNEQVIDVSIGFDGWDWKDVLVAIKKVSEEEFGWINGITEIHWWGEERPAEIDIIVDVKNGKTITEKCFWGKFEVAAWDKAHVDCRVGNDGAAKINAKTKKKFSKGVSSFYDKIRTHLEHHSIYKGKTVVVTGKSNHFNTSFDFEIIENKSTDRIFLNPNEQLVLDNFIIGDLDATGKKCYLFTGPYGNGKTETAMAIGREGNLLGMPFFYVKDAVLFDQVLNLSKKYQPCIIFLEDVDEIGGGVERDEKMNKILNTLDGVQTKGNNITVIFTTNHEEKINPALRRPGRIDLVINFVNPDQETRKAILQGYFINIEGEQGLDYEELSGMISDVSGSVVAQIAKRGVKLAARKGYIDNKIVQSAIVSMEYHIQLMAGPIKQDSIEMAFVRSLAGIMAGAVKESVTEGVARMEEILDEKL